jgi:hypothetical protein
MYMYAHVVNRQPALYNSHKVKTQISRHTSLIVRAFSRYFLRDQLLSIRNCTNALKGT